MYFELSFVFALLQISNTKLPNPEPALGFESLIMFSSLSVAGSCGSIWL